MRLTQITLAVATLLSTAAAQGLGDLPNCAKTCATSSIPAKCGIDVACICKSKSFLGDIACCVADKCTKAEQETTIQVAKSICARGGVTDLPNSVVCSSNASTSATASDTTLSGSVTPTATNTEASTTTTGTGTSASTTAGSSSSASSASSASSSASSAAATTGAAILGQNKDSSLMAAAGAAAAFAILV